MQKEHFGVRGLLESDGHGSQERGLTGQVWAGFRCGRVSGLVISGGQDGLEVKMGVTI